MLPIFILHFRWSIFLVLALGTRFLFPWHLAFPKRFLHLILLLVSWWVSLNFCCTALFSLCSSFCGFWSSIFWAAVRSAAPLSPLHQLLPVVSLSNIGGTTIGCYRQYFFFFIVCGCLLVVPLCRPFRISRFRESYGKLMSESCIARWIQRFWAYHLLSKRSISVLIIRSAFNLPRGFEQFWLHPSGSFQGWADIFLEPWPPTSLPVDVWGIV